MASKEAKSEESKAADAAPVFAFQFKLAKDKIGEKTTNPQVRSKVNEAFQGFGAFSETRVNGDVGTDRVVTIFFTRLMAKGQPVWDALGRGEAQTIKLYDEDVALGKSDAKPSGGGAATGTSHRPKKATPDKKAGGRGKPREGDAKAEGKAGEGKGDAKDGKDAKDAKDGDRKEGGRGRGRGKKEEAKVSLQRGRANIGGKLGPVSKIRLARAEKAKKEAEAKARAERGEKPLEEEKKEEPVEEKKEEKKEEKGKKGDAKKEGGKKEGGKKEAGKAEGGKKEGGKKEAPKGKGK